MAANIKLSDCLIAPPQAALLELCQRLRRLLMVERGGTCHRLGGGTDVDLVLHRKPGGANRILQNQFLP